MRIIFSILPGFLGFILSYSLRNGNYAIAIMSIIGVIFCIVGTLIDE